MIAESRIRHGNHIYIAKYPPQALFIKQVYKTNVVYEKCTLGGNHKRGNTVSAAGASYTKKEKHYNKSCLFMDKSSFYGKVIKEVTICPPQALFIKVIQETKYGA